MKGLIQIFMLLLCATSAALAGGLDAATEKKLDEVIAGDHRSDKNKARDKYRNPKETLAFFGIKKDMTVVEISPGGGGWYTEILAPLLAESGTYYAAGPDPEKDGDYGKRSMKQFNEKLASNPKAYGKVKKSYFSRNHPEVAPVGQADMVLTFRNIHNWGSDDAQKAIFSRFYRALKSDGVLGVVEHRTDKGAEQKPSTGYMSEAYVIKIAESVGFKYVGSSEVNANAKDTKDHEKGVWTLPPVLATKDKDGDKYLAIGESDRMTLKFVKK